MSRWLAHRLYDLCYWPAWFFATILMSLRVSGRHRMPATGPVLLMANHTSSLDPPVIGAGSRRRLTYLARKTLFENPAFSWLIRLYGAVPIDQEGTGADGLRTVLAELKRGEVVLIFPEGHRTRDGALQPLKAGISLVIKKARVPVVPCGIAGGYQAWPPGQWLPRLAPIFLPARGLGLGVVFGRPIPPERFEGLSREEILALLSEEMRKVVARAEAIRRK